MKKLFALLIFVVSLVCYDQAFAQVNYKILGQCVGSMTVTSSYSALGGAEGVFHQTDFRDRYSGVGTVGIAGEGTFGGAFTDKKQAEVIGGVLSFTSRGAQSVLTSTTEGETTTGELNGAAAGASGVLYTGMTANSFSTPDGLAFQHQTQASKFGVLKVGAFQSIYRGFSTTPADTAALPTTGVERVSTFESHFTFTGGLKTKPIDLQYEVKFIQ